MPAPSTKVRLGMALTPVDLPSDKDTGQESATPFMATPAAEGPATWLSIHWRWEQRSCVQEYVDLGAVACGSGCSDQWTCVQLADLHLKPRGLSAQITRTWMHAAEVLDAGPGGFACSRVTQPVGQRL
jgi:hypothetical protein